MKKNIKQYRFLEMIPGLFAWTAITFPIWGAYLIPKVVAYFVIAFLIYWMYQSFKSAIFAIIGYFKITSSKATNWLTLFNDHFRIDWLKYSQINHVIIISSYREPVEIIDMAVGSLASQVDIDLKKLIVIIAQEQRAGADNNSYTNKYFTKLYGHTFGKLLFTEHPSNLPGETIGKHSNEGWAAKYFKKNFIDTFKIINLENSNFDQL